MGLAWWVSADACFDALRGFSEGQGTQGTVSKAPELLRAAGRHFGTAIAGDAALQIVLHQGTKGMWVLGVWLGCRVGARLL